MSNANTEISYAIDVIGDVMGRCPRCGEPKEDPGLLQAPACRDWHKRCNQCFEFFDNPKGEECRRRRHSKTVTSTLHQCHQEATWESLLRESETVEELYVVYDWAERQNEWTDDFNEVARVRKLELLEQGSKAA